MSNISLLGNTTRVEAPYIKITIGDFTFSIYQRIRGNEKNASDFYLTNKTIYPNYVQSLQVTKINGQVNTYSLSIKYPVRSGDDPNFFEKVFSSVSKTRKIVFSYGDMSLPTYVYKNEEAIITEIKTDFNIQSSVISYTVNAVSSAALSLSGTYTFTNTNPKKPSDEIFNLLYNPEYGLLDVFTGMSSKALVEAEGLIRRDDKIVQLETKTNISALEYLNYLVSCMIPADSTKAVKQNIIYMIHLLDDTTGKFGGPYFKIDIAQRGLVNQEAYELDVGYPSANIVTSFSIDNQENYSLYYDWQEKLNDNNYTQQLNDDGEWEKVFAPVISSKNNTHTTRASDSVWWTKVTQYPISATITLKGLLRPAILMTYVNLNVYFFGRKHISSGLYIVTKQIDTIDTSGYRTQLSLTRIEGSESEVAGK